MAPYSDWMASKIERVPLGLRAVADELRAPYLEGQKAALGRVAEKDLAVAPWDIISGIVHWVGRALIGVAKFVPHRLESAVGLNPPFIIQDCGSPNPTGGQIL